MRLTMELGAAVVASVVLFPATVGAMLDCKKMVDENVAFNFEKLGGKKTVTETREDDVGLRESIDFNIDICNALSIPDFGFPKEPLCAVRTREGDDKPLDVIPIVQSREVSSGNHINPTYTLLRPDDDNDEIEGIRAELTGTKFDKKPQRAIIDFLCRREGDEKRTVHRMENDDDGGDGEDGNPDGDGNEGDPGDRENLKETDDGEGGKLTLVSWHDDPDANTLRLKWSTKYACRGATGDGGGDDMGSKGGWGFFSWFFFLFFLGIIGYFGFFAWVNYSKYGAQGWDLVPHADTIRDIPYILGDWGRKIVGTFTGGPSRGGYSAV